MSATSSRQSMPSIRKVDSACSSQTVHAATSAPPPQPRHVRSLLDVLEPLREQSDDVLIVERVVDEPAVPPRTDESHAAQQPELMGDGRLADADTRRQLVDAELRARQRIEDADARRIAEHLEGLGQRGHGRVGEHGGNASLLTHEHMSICSYVDLNRARGLKAKGAKVSRAGWAGTA